MNKSKLNIAMAALAFVSISGVSHAAPAVSDISTQTVEVQVTANTAPITFELSPVRGLAVGHYVAYTPLLDWVIKLANTSAMPGIRWTPDVVSQTIDSTGQSATIAGKNNPDNKLVMNISSHQLNWEMFDVGGEKWYTDEANSGYGRQTGVLETIGSGEFVADIYPVSLDAAVYNP